MNETRRLGHGEWGMVWWRLGWKAGREASGVGEWKVESRMWRVEGGTPKRRIFCKVLVQIGPLPLNADSSFGGNQIFETLKKRRLLVEKNDY